jgi:FkbM family methyltransferase
MSRKKNKRKYKKSSYDNQRSMRREILSNKLLFNMNAELKKAIQYHQSGQLQKAEEIYKKVLEINPDHSDSLHLSGIIAHQSGKNDIAANLINRAIQTRPDEPVYYLSLGSVYKAQGRLDEAILSYQKAMELKPDYAEAYNSLGVAFYAQGRLDEAILHYKKALQLNPDFAMAYNNIGVVFKDQGRLDKAIWNYKKVLELNPDLVEAYDNLGVAFYTQDRLDEAISCFQKALELNPDYAKAYNNLGIAFYPQGKLEEAALNYQKALELNPDYAEAYNNLGAVLKSQSRINEAISCYQKALQIKPDFTTAHSNLLYILHYHEHIDSEQLFLDHKQWAKLHALPLSNAIQPHLNDRSPERRLRVGYVSPDFCMHPVACFIEPVLASHDRSAFEIFCYSNVVCPDVATDYLKGLADCWRDIVGMSDEQVANLVRNDQIDILVDLAGHTAYNRMLLFARKPAPVQATYIGYPNTTGLPTMDYRITDSWADPSGQTDHLYTEKLVRLPSSFLCYKPPKETPIVAKLPALKTRQITFGSFNNLAKVTPEVIVLWSAILAEVPNARMIVKSKALADKNTRQRIQEMFVKNGVSATQINLTGFAPSFAEHLELYNSVDIGLDTFPYNGTTTTCEAMWMGVPVIVLAGQSHASRVGVSLLSNVGLTDLIAGSTEAYLKKAVKLAGDLKRLEKLRTNLRDMMLHSPLTNADRFTRALEDVYREMWRHWCHQSNKSNQPMDETSLTVKIKGDIEVCVPNSIELLTPYVLLEQEDWFESEVKFVRHMLKPGMQVIDIGANYGLYTLAMAKAVDSKGKVWAFEPTSNTAGYLQKSIQLNKMTNVKLIQAGLSSHRGKAELSLNPNSELNELIRRPEKHKSYETIQLFSLDDCLAKNGWEDIAFVKLDAEGEESNIIKGGSQFLSSQSPLIMFEVKHGKELNLGLMKEFADYGYETYKLIPGLNLLAPFDLTEPPDPYQLNLFCCKKDCAHTLEEHGLLVNNSPCASTCPPIDGELWVRHIGTLPYAKKVIQRWISSSHRSPIAGWGHYQEALNYYVRAHSGNVSSADRYACLQKSLSILSMILDTHVNFSRLQTFARVTWEMGKRQIAIQALDLLVDMFRHEQQLGLSEPFLPVTSRFDLLDPGGNLESWCLASILEQRVKLGHFSSYYTGKTLLTNLENLKNYGFQGAEMERRRQLIRIRCGMQDGPEYSPVLSLKTKDNLNPEFWGGHE